MSTRSDFEDWPRLRPLVIDALDQAPMHRIAFLNRACGGDETLRKRAESFLRAYERGEDMLKPPSSIQELDPLVGQRIGNFTILRLVGCGGMGAVYQARQDQPSRLVALKLMRSSAVSKSAQRRFEYESQLLARLHHPGIAQVFEAGTYDPQPAHPLGRIPYFAMEYVPHGVPITRFAEIKALSVRDRLELFARVCDAVQHGHQNGVIHRDLKPANILVGDDLGSRDGETKRRRDEVDSESKPASRITSSLRSAPVSTSLPQPKIIDFGVGRAIDADAQAVTLATTVGQIIGTLQYLAPERLGPPTDAGHAPGSGGSGGDVRSDIYSLGVTLYELLSGRAPHALDGVALPEALQMIREVDPPALSTINRDLRGDVETIVGKAMEKDPHRRYQSAAEFASDIRCYLCDEPISAHPPSATYHIRSFARRNRALVWGVAAAFVIMTAGIIGVTLALTRSVKMEKQALAERDRARKSVAFLKSMLTSANPLLASGTPFDVYDDPYADVFEGQTWIPATTQPGAQAGQRREYTSAELMAHAARLLDTSFQDEPELWAEVADTLGVTMAKLGLDADNLLQEAVEIRRRVLGDDHPDTINSCIHLGVVLTGGGVAPEGEPYLRLAYESLIRTRGADDPKTLAASLVVVGCLSDQQRHDEAIELTRHCAELAERRFGPDHPVTLMQLRSLSNITAPRDREASIALMRRVIEGQTKHFGRASIPVAASLNLLAWMLRYQGVFDEAEALTLESLSNYRARFGSDTLRTLDAERGLFEIHRRQGRFDDAVADVRSNLASSRRVHNPDHHQIIRLEDRLARALLDAIAARLADVGTSDSAAADIKSAADEAVELAQHAADVSVRLWGVGNVLTILYHDTLAEAIRAQGRPTDAETVIQRWLRSDVDDQIVSAVHQTHAACLIDLKRFDEAERALTLATARSTPEATAGDPYEPRRRELWETWVRMYEESGRAVEAEPYRAKLRAMMPAKTATATQQ